MISTLGAIIIAAAVSVSFFIVVAVSIILLLRAKDKRRRNKEEIARQLSAGQRGRLSVDSSNYSHVPEPRTTLRRSIHLPYGVGSGGWAAIPSQEGLVQQPRTCVDAGPGVASELIHQKRRRSLRASFSANSFSLPRTRRQKKIEKAIPLRAMPHSPLSAITEQSVTNTNEASPSGAFVELPTEITPKATPDKDADALPVERPCSPDWPLTSAKGAACSAAPTVIPVQPNRQSALMRMNSTGHSIPLVRPLLGQRSVSVTGGLSMAPEDPLPPLPLIAPNQWPTGRRSRLRLSAASMETIGSSVLEGRTTPSQADTDPTSLRLGTPSIDFDLTGPSAYQRESQIHGPTAVTITGSPKARRATRYRTGQAGYGSAKVNKGNRSSFQDTRSEQFLDSEDHSSFIPRPLRLNLSTIGPTAAIGKPNSPSRANSVRSCASSSIHGPIARTGIGPAVNVRHSMYEHHSGFGRFVMEPAILGHVSRDQSSPIRRPESSRPASIANEYSFGWDRNSPQISLPSSLRASPGSQKLKDHKRQNCIRITNLPVVEVDRGASKLLQMAGEEEEWRKTGASKMKSVPGLSLPGRGKQGEDAVSGQEYVGNSPFHARPILEPTSWKGRSHCRALSSTSTVSCKRDSDVFGNPGYNSSAPNIFAENETLRGQWPLSTPPHGVQARSTVPSLRPIQEPFDPDSPTLPTPPISSAALFARTLPVGSRTSGVQGPRNLPTPSRSYQNASPSLTTARSTAKRKNLRRTAMTLRKQDSDAKDPTMMSQIYRDLSEGSTNNPHGVNKKTEQSPAGRSPAGGGSVNAQVRSPPAPQTRVHPPSIKKRRVSVSPSAASTVTSGGLPFSKSRSRIAPSPSTISAGATSIWEDASVGGGDSPEPELPDSSKSSFPQLIDVEACENLFVQGKPGWRDKDRESRLTSPQGKGLGLMGVQVQGKVWGTPGSLYDRDGFLKE